MWQAQFSNGDILNAINEDGKEILFGKVLARLDDLESLSIIMDDKVFRVRMEDGRFSAYVGENDPIHFFASGVDIDSLDNIRPIYFVRETVHFGTHAAALAPDTFPGTPAVNFTALGFQANLAGRNIKRYLAILPNGEYAIRDE